MLAVWRALTALEKECLSSPISDAACELSVARRTGCFLGLASAFCGMCSEGRTESRVHAVSTLEKLEHTLLNTPQDTLVYEVGSEMYVWGWIPFAQGQSVRICCYFCL